MSRVLSRTEITNAGLGDWQFLLGRIEGHFTLPNYLAAAGFSSQVAVIAEAANHHPSTDLRYPAEVLIALTTHSAGGVTQLDLDLARQISKLAQEVGASSSNRVKHRVEVAIDAFDIPSVAPFWEAALGYEFFNGVLVDPLGQGPPFWFQQMDHPRTERNNLHIDITVTPAGAQDRINAAIEAGGELISDENAPAFWVLADAEGNEACICTWEGRD